MSDNFREDLKLDKYDLVKNALDQPDLFGEWGAKWADAVYERDRLKDLLSLVRAECDQAIREMPSEFGWQKSEKSPTEAFINSAIATHPDYVEANENFQNAQHDVNIMLVAKESFEQRGKMINIISQLYLSGYYSGNKKLDKGYQELMDTESSKQQTENLEQSPRIASRLKRTSGV